MDEGTPKEITKTADSGKSITSCFCGDCGRRPVVHNCLAPTNTNAGTTIFRYGDSFGGKDGARIIKTGVLDDVNIINSKVPTTELFAPERIKWVQATEGAQQVDAMPG